MFAFGCLCVVSGYCTIRCGWRSIRQGKDKVDEIHVYSITSSKKETAGIMPGFVALTDG